MEKHPVKVAGYEGSLCELSTAIAEMRYDKIQEFLEYLSKEFNQQSESDGKRGRLKLSAKLGEISQSIDQAVNQMSEVWKICKHRM
jgi:uncharacterized coiled-coil protein SlyX